MKKLTPRQKFIVILAAILTTWVVCGMVLYAGMQIAIKIFGQTI